jgi:hypothetical protein
VDEFGVTETQAREAFARNDRARTAYVRQFYRLDATDPSHYHLVIDSTRIPLRRPDRRGGSIPRQLIPGCGDLVEAVPVSYRELANSHPERVRARTAPSRWARANSSARSLSSRSPRCTLDRVHYRTPMPAGGVGRARRAQRQRRRGR